MFSKIALECLRDRGVAFPLDLLISRRLKGSVFKSLWGFYVFPLFLAFNDLFCLGTAGHPFMHTLRIVFGGDRNINSAATCRASADIPVPSRERHLLGRRRVCFPPSSLFCRCAPDGPRGFSSQKTTSSFIRSGADFSRFRLKDLSEIILFSRLNGDGVGVTLRHGFP